MIISVNADSERDPNEEGREGFESETGTPFSLDEYRLRLFRTHLLDRVPPDVTGADLRGRGVASVSRRILQNAIDEVLSTRNQILPAEERINYRQLFNFQYSDGALILTVGGIFFKEADRSKFDACSFGSLDFIKTGEGPLVIKAPCLTLKELRSLNSQLPAAEADIQIPKLFSAGDVLDAPALIQRFRNASDPVSTFLWNAFSAEAQTRLTSGELNSEEAHTSIANELNRLLRDPGVYDEERFTGIEISDVTRELLQQNPEGDTLIRVNRKLLECAYPYELKRTGPLVPGVPPSQIEQYAKIYRYFPTFAEAILS